MIRKERKKEQKRGKSESRCHVGCQYGVNWLLANYKTTCWEFQFLQTKAVEINKLLLVLQQRWSSSAWAQTLQPPNSSKSPLNWKTFKFHALKIHILTARHQPWFTFVFAWASEKKRKLLSNQAALIVFLLLLCPLSLLWKTQQRRQASAILSGKLQKLKKKKNTSLWPWKVNSA